MDNFKLNRKQKKALEQFEKSARKLAKTNVALFVKPDDEKICVAGLTKRQYRDIRGWIRNYPPEDENNYDVVTEEMDKNMTPVKADYAFFWHETEIAIKKKK